MPAVQTTTLNRYGPWALIAGASHGVGAAFARKLAAEGLNLVLVARRPDALGALKRQLTEAFGIEVLLVVQDLSRSEAATNLLAAVGDRSIGLLVYNAGGDPYITRFLDSTANDWAALLRLNAQTVMESCHAFGAPMLKRGRGGVILVGSQAALGGIRKLGMYCATKAFALTLGEALWAEWKDQGVDVLNLLIGTVDTPTMRDAMARLKVPGGATMALPSAEDIVDVALSELPNGPTFVHPEDIAPTGPRNARRQHVLDKSAEAATFIGD